MMSRYAQKVTVGGRLHHRVTLGGLHNTRDHASGWRGGLHGYDGHGLHNGWLLDAGHRPAVCM